MFFESTVSGILGIIVGIWIINTMASCLLGIDIIEEIKKYIERRSGDR